MFHVKQGIFYQFWGLSILWEMTPHPKELPHAHGPLYGGDIYLPKILGAK